MYLYVYIYLCGYVYIYICTCMYVCMYVVYVYTNMLHVAMLGSISRFLELWKPSVPVDEADVPTC